MPKSLDQLLAQVPGSTPELMQWVQAQLAAGRSRHSVERSLLDAGWPPSMAHAALTACTTADIPLSASSAAPPSPDLHSHPGSIDVGDRQVHVLMSLQHPHVVLFSNLLSAKECEQIIADAQPSIARSRTVITQQSPSEINSDRTSQGMFFTRGQTPVVQKLESRIARLLRWPIGHGEGLQVLRYLPGAQYKPHHDYFHPSEASSAHLLQRGGQRLGTLVIYLNDVPAGGCTYFPQSQLRIHPRQGHAVFFAYPQANPQSLTLHAGEPVLQGEKWIATKWLREREFY